MERKQDQAGQAGSRGREGSQERSSPGNRPKGRRESAGEAGQEQPDLRVRTLRQDNDESGGH